VPDALLTKTAELKPYFKISYEYAKSLKPKLEIVDHPDVRRRGPPQERKMLPVRRWYSPRIQTIQGLFIKYLRLTRRTHVEQVLSIGRRGA
jgi:hypothetical protein